VILIAGPDPFIALTVHVALGFRELHLIHALARVPVQEGLAPEHGRELLGNSLEKFLKGGTFDRVNGIILKIFSPKELATKVAILTRR
jgi:hypothetical protein